jgi:hypothetical protein
MLRRYICHVYRTSSHSFRIMKICAACVAYYAADIRERILVRDILHSEVSFSFLYLSLYAFERKQLFIITNAPELQLRALGK